MNEHDEPNSRGDGSPDRFTRLAEGIGDLANPFFHEERQRDVWNEAAAIGLQVTLWVSTAAAAAMLWIGGTTALPYAVTTFTVPTIASGVALAHAARLGVRVEDPRWFQARRLLPYALLVIAFLAGLVHAAPENSFGSGMIVGAVGGGTLALIFALISVSRARRRPA